MSGAEYFDDADAINAHMDEKVPVDTNLAVWEHAQIESAFKEAGIEVLKVHPPKDCQDGVYTANWGLVKDGRAVLSNLPNKRLPEAPYAEMSLRALGLEVLKLPPEIPFSGQGDALPCGKYLFIGSTYRTSVKSYKYLQEHLGFEVIGLQTIPKLDVSGNPVINALTGWPDSYFYDLDLALAVIREDLIAWCPEAFTDASRDKIRALKDIEKIEVSYKEASQGFACNLVSTGSAVVMSARAPRFKEELESLGLKVITPEVTELAKGGGFIRCTSLTLS